MDKEKITTEVSNIETVTLGNEPFDFEEGMEYAYHQAILSLKKHMDTALKPYKLLLV